MMGGALNRSIESFLRFVSLTSSGILAGSLGFGEAALVPGWEQELGRDETSRMPETRYFNAIGPVALASAVTLAVAASSVRRIAPLPRDATASVTALASATGPIALKYFVSGMRDVSSRPSSCSQPGTSAASPKPSEPARMPDEARFTNRSNDSIERFNAPPVMQSPRP